MNLQIFLLRLRGKATLVKGQGTSIGNCARILNASGDSKRIRVGRNCRIEGELFVFAHDGQISIGDWCFVGPGARLWSALELTIGDRVLISHNVNVMDSLTHPLDARERHEQFRAILKEGHPKSIDLDEKSVHIEDDAWIGAGATVLRGVTIGRGAVVGAGAVVTHDVPPFTVVAGNPARVVRHLNDKGIEA
jgi:acetyltransferase-like isoleucine patch superfamily enzyme